MKVISTFAGCGGSSLGYRRAGCSVLAAVEWDANAAACYRANHPAAHLIEGDIAHVRGEDLLDATGLDVGELDILDGSPPCQGFSAAGRRAFDDPRNALFREHLRLVDELQPRSVVIENVAGLVLGKMRRVAAEIVRELQRRGYRVAAGLVDCAAFGIAQHRRRTFFIASRVVRPSLPPPAVRRNLTAGEALHGIDPGEIPPITAPSIRLLARHMRPGECGHKALLRLGRGKGSFSRAMLDPDKPAPTITTKALDYLHWERRLLTVRERLVLTGFPADYRLPGTFSTQCARVGNSVAPPATTAIARALGA